MQSFPDEDIQFTIEKVWWSSIDYLYTVSTIGFRREIRNHLIVIPNHVLVQLHRELLLLNDPISFRRFVPTLFHPLFGSTAFQGFDLIDFSNPSMEATIENRDVLNTVGLNENHGRSE